MIYMLTKERKGEIAIAIVKAMIKKERFQLDASQMIREIGNKVASNSDFQEVSVTKEEAIEFVAEMMKDLMGKFVSDLEKSVKSDKVGQ